MVSNLTDSKKLLQETFIAEAREQIQRIVDNLIKIETTPDEEKRSKLIELAFRDFHNIKGSSRAVDFDSVEMICHPLEDLMAALKRKQIAFSAELLDLLISNVCLVEKFLDLDQDTAKNEAVDARETILRFMDSIGLKASGSALKSGNSKKSADSKRTPASTRSAAATSTSAPTTITPAPSSSPTEMTPATGTRENNGNSNVNSQTANSDTHTHSESGRSETLRIDADKLDSLMQKAEEMLSIKAMAREQSISTQSLLSKLDSALKAWHKSAPEIKAARKLMEKLQAQSCTPAEQIVWRKMLDFLEWNKQRLQ